MPDTTTLLDRVRKLLTKAEDPAVTEEEAEAYNTKAAELIATYGIDQALLADRHARSDEIASIEIIVDQPYAVDKAGLLHHIAIALRCRAVLCGPKPRIRAVVVGFRSDLDRVELLFTSLLMQGTTQLVGVRPEPGFYRESVAAYRRTWLAGFTKAVYQRLEEAEERAATEAAETTSGERSVAVVLVDRNTRVARAFHEQFPHTRKGNRRQLSGSGYFDGHYAGRRADLGTTRLGHRSAAISAR
jgi:hypothetical protein